MIWKPLVVLALAAMPSIASAQTATPPAPPSPMNVVIIPPPPETLATRAAPRGDPELWVAVEDYPGTSLRAGEHGAVDVVLTIDATGRTNACKIEKSSGSAVLDATTCTLLKRRSRFVPATDRNGQPSADVWAHRYEWTLPTS